MTNHNCETIHTKLEYYFSVVYQTIALPQEYYADDGYAYYADAGYAYYADDDYESACDGCDDADGVVGVYTYGASETNSGSSVGGSKIF